MKKNLALPIVMAAVLGLQAFDAQAAAPVCKDLFRDKPVAEAKAEEPAVEFRTVEDVIRDENARRQLLEAVEEIQGLEQSVDLARRFNGQYQRSSLIRAQRRLEAFDEHLGAGEVDSALDIYRFLFRQTELNYWTVKSTDQSLAELAQMTDSPALRAEVKRLKTERMKAIKIIGENYGEYVAAREHLEHIIDTKGDIGPSAFGPMVNATARQHSDAQAVIDPGIGIPQTFGPENVALADPAVATQGRNKPLNIGAQQALVHPESPAEQRLYAETAERVLKNLGVNNLTSLFPGRGLPGERASLKDIKHLFRTEPEALKAKLKKDRADGIWTSLKVFTLAEPIVKVIEGALNKLPTKYSDPVKMIIGLARGMRVRDKYMPMIERILNLPNEPLIRLEMLRKLNTQNPGDEFLVIFARTVDGTQTWSDMKAECERQGATNSIYATYHKRMETAEARAAKLKDDLSLHYTSTPADKVAIIAAGGVPVSLYFGSQHLPALANGFHHFASFVGSIFGF